MARSHIVRIGSGTHLNHVALKQSLSSIKFQGPTQKFKMALSTAGGLAAVEMLGRGRLKEPIAIA
jgi:hypothetical protein